MKQIGIRYGLTLKRVCPAARRTNHKTRCAYCGRYFRRGEIGVQILGAASSLKWTLHEDDCRKAFCARLMGART